MSDQKTQVWEVVVTDLWAEPEGGWSANGCWTQRTEVVVPSDISDAALVRRLKSAAGIQGMRSDAWSGAEFSWRDGTIGAYADLVS